MGTSCKGATSRRPRKLLAHRPKKIKQEAIYVVEDKKRNKRITLQQFNKQREIPIFSPKPIKPTSKYTPGAK